MGITAKPIGKFESIMRKVKNKKEKEHQAQKAENSSKDSK